MERRVSRLVSQPSIIIAPPTLVVAGTNSGVGKTTVALGLMQALRRLGLTVQPFKVGPDFLDPLQHEHVCGLPSVNLDGWLMGRERCLAAFDDAVSASNADIAIVEGCMGLHDGRSGSSDEGSTAQVAKWLDAAVILVVDAFSLARSAAAMVHGYRTFDAEVDVAAAIFNRVGGDSHGAWLREALASCKTTRDVKGEKLRGAYQLQPSRSLRFTCHSHCLPTFAQGYKNRGTPSWPVSTVSLLVIRREGPPRSAPGPFRGPR